MEPMASGWGVGLLEYMGQRSGSSYLSDLQYPSGWEQMRIAREVSRIPLEAYPLETWKDASEYLTGLPPDMKASAAKDKMIQYLVKKRCGLFP